MQPDGYGQTQLPSREEVNMTDQPVVEPRVRPGNLHEGCGGTIILRQGDHGRFLGCTGDGTQYCRVRWNEHGWQPVAPRRLYATPTGLPATFVPDRHPGHWTHHHMILPTKMPGDFSRVPVPLEGQWKISLWSQWREAITRADRQRVAERSVERQLEIS
jgi:hypothetical protein